MTTKSVGDAWHKDGVVSFDLPDLIRQNDTIFHKYRDNNNYPYNLFLIVSLEC
jgi:hypothetical protein